ncbi:tRNA 2-selenouridine(34) synthase MnmH [Sulfitobacter sp. PS-8MA]|uniref:tRNA 2-selenouridine(34) synthase MnmH n=1 Tax=Sulfitobacter sp. PS-8MA TaxID=3237707 RepID=UPI0034C6B094
MTPCTLTALSDLATLNVDTIIDVRAPAEYAEDHLPGAINLPVLSDAERAEVGTIYKQVSPFDARKIGGALVAQNTARHLQGALADKNGSWQPLVYCWRGGQRSGAFSTILDQIGWRVQLLRGGYRSYRRLVVETLYARPLPHRLMLIEGGTGTAKTRLLHHLAETGAQVLDLEGLAQHRGSLFGAMKGGQPPQKMFETGLAQRLGALDPARVTWVEAESSKIGDCTLPPALWSVMSAAPRVEITAPLAARAHFLCRAYDDLTATPSLLETRIDRLRPYHSGETLTAWLAQARAGDWASLAEALIGQHYDPRYAKAASRNPAPVARLSLRDLDEPTLAETAAALHTRFNADA